MFIKQENINDIFNKETSDSEEDSADNIPNLENLFGSLRMKPFSKFKKGNMTGNKTANKPLNKAPLIEKNLKITFDELYNKDFKKVKIKVSRNRNGKFIQKDKILKIPLYNKTVLLKNEGNEIRGYSIGDIQINIVLEKRTDLIRIGEYNLLYFKEIDLADVYHNIDFDIEISKETIIKVKSMPLISNQFLSSLQVIKKKGIRYPEGSGDLFIFYKIKLPKKSDSESKLESESEERVEDNMGYRDYAINCKLERLFI
jgi:DnaJ-class molecular chaperone